ncbi:NACHT domain-containing protein [Streptomyces sp. NBC_01727]|uniref:NACHT domain-containing protein n=1 Tax=Streptomyces sp. NBC_01727 TaxID=2975924 RepID=UPI002E11B784|nr:NACHT domain-containing protein [Streptomyces sp. NBC_01727]
MVGRVAGEAVKKSFSSLTSSDNAFPEWEEEVDHSGGLLVNDAETGEPLAILTQDQASQVSELFETPECLALVQFLLIAKIGCRQPDAFEEIAEGFYDAFLDLAEIYCSERNFNWAGLASPLWGLLLQYLESVFPNDQLTAFVSADEIQRMSSYLGTVQKISGRSQPANVAFRDLVDIAGDSSRFETARNTLYDIRHKSTDYYAEVNLAHALSHSQESFRFERETLYVTRSLRRYNTSDGETDEFLSVPRTRPRCVVIGNPGVGKSTMVQHVVHKLSSNDSASGHDFAPLVIQCKEFASPDSGTYILESLTKSLRDNLQLDIENQAIGDLLTLGRGFVVFDGIDEIIDISRRQRFVKAVEAFASRYPLSPILVTARRVGYQKAPLNSSEFSLYELDDFSDEQVEEYTEKWFRVTGRSDEEREAFLRESESIPDVCVNPLMLSLLCTLYRARGYIPRNRRAVYQACADLMFQRWDSMRQIEQPMDHRHYGTRLMQELALFFYRSQSAQGGVEERQLRRIITTFFSDTASVETFEASRRAEHFLDFCADRAWLLTSQGTTDRGERVFGFTHRTFMEYFSAEAIVRRARSLDEIVDEVAVAYDKDSSSVLADVIVQCADEKYDRGAEEIINGLLERTRSLGKAQASKYISLSLRILNSAPVPKTTTDAVFAGLFEYWDRSNMNATEASANALFDLYRDPRNRLHSLLQWKIALSEPADAIAVLERWSRFYMSGETMRFDQAWDPQMRDIATSLYEQNEDVDSVSRAYMMTIGIYGLDRLSVKNPPNWLLFVNKFGPTPDSSIPGPLVNDLIAVARGGVSSSPLIDWVDSEALKAWRVQWPEHYAAALTKASNHFPSLSSGDWQAVSPAGSLLLWLCCSLYEVSFPSSHPFHDVAHGAFEPGWFKRATEARTSRVLGRAEGRDPGGPFPRTDVIEQAGGAEFPSWFQTWCKGRLSFVPKGQIT